MQSPSLVNNDQIQTVSVKYLLGWVGPRRGSFDLDPDNSFCKGILKVIRWSSILQLYSKFQLHFEIVLVIFHVVSHAPQQINV